MIFLLSEKFTRNTKLGRFLSRITTVGAIVGTPLYTAEYYAYIQYNKASQEPIHHTFTVPNPDFRLHLTKACEGLAKKKHEWVRLGLLLENDQLIPITLPCAIRQSFVEKLHQEAPKAIAKLAR